MKVKICGLTCRKDMDYVLEAGADYGGMVISFPESRRNLSIDTARMLIRYARAGGRAGQKRKMEFAAVTVSPDPALVSEIISAGFDTLQVHGTLTEETLDILRERKFPLIRALNRPDAGEIRRLQDLDILRAFLFDAREPGSGVTFDWSEIPSRESLGKPFFLAGGLTPENVGQAVNAVHPDGVDVSSGVELSAADAAVLAGFTGLKSLTDPVLYTGDHCRNSEISMKDLDKIRAFIRNAKA